MQSSVLNEKRIAQHLRNFERVMDGYQENEPFARYLTATFKQNKQMGSSDRKWVSRLCYNYFRLGKAAEQVPREQRLIIAEFLCEQESAVVAWLEPSYMAYIGRPTSEKIEFLENKGILNRNDLFPFVEALSAGIEVDDFLLSILRQPDLFIRVKAGCLSPVLDIFQRNDIAFRQIGKNTVALQNGVNLQRFTELKGLVEVQDLSSQQTLQLMKPGKAEYWWDACAASGGKSLLLLDAQPTVHVLVSDVRMSILRNLDERFESAGIKQYRKKLLDLTKDPTALLGDEHFDGIILDAPCTGAGTWGRTPEMIRQFNMTKIEEFSRLQKNIAGHVSKFLKPGKPLVYITCSVFRKENEEVIGYIVKELGFTLEEQKVFKGYRENADSMFAARLIKQ